MIKNREAAGVGQREVADIGQRGRGVCQMGTGDVRGGGSRGDGRQWRELLKWGLLAKTKECNRQVKREAEDRLISLNLIRTVPDTH